MGQRFINEQVPRRLCHCFENLLVDNALCLQTLNESQSRSLRRHADTAKISHRDGLSFSNTTACTAIPSSRPTKPSFSVVVALTLI